MKPPPIYISGLVELGGTALLDQLEPEKIASFVGSLVGAFFHVVQSLFGGGPITGNVIVRAAIESIFALFAGFMGAVYFGPLLAQVKVFDVSLSLEAASFAVGLVFYKTMPAFLALAEGFLKKKAEEK